MDFDGFWLSMLSIELSIGPRSQRPPLKAPSPASPWLQDWICQISCLMTPVGFLIDELSEDVGSLRVPSEVHEMEADSMKMPFVNHANLLPCKLSKCETNGLASSNVAVASNPI